VLPEGGKGQVNLLLKQQVELAGVAFRLKRQGGKVQRNGGTDTGAHFPGILALGPGQAARFGNAKMLQPFPRRMARMQPGAPTAQFREQALQPLKVFLRPGVFEKGTIEMKAKFRGTKRLPLGVSLRLQFQASPE
jgi:hypothetical protein